MKKWGRIVWAAAAALFIVCLIYLCQTGKQCEAVLDVESIYHQD